MEKYPLEARCYSHGSQMENWGWDASESVPKWLEYKDLLTFKLISPRSLPLETTVSELIDKEHCWNEPVIRQHFQQDYADQILKIPLPRQPRSYQVLWHYDKKDDYLVKSGYQLALQLKFPNKPSS